MTINELLLTPARWQRLAPALRQALGGTSAILGRPVLAIARDLCARSAYGLAFDFYQALDGQPVIPYQGCGLGLLMNLRDLMGEDPAPIGETLVLQVEQVMLGDDPCRPGPTRGQGGGSRRGLWRTAGGVSLLSAARRLGRARDQRGGRVGRRRRRWSSWGRRWRRTTPPWRR